jgi:ketosteroid isomerase-like protein
MTIGAISRRAILEASICALAASGIAPVASARKLDSQSDDVVRRYYRAWEVKDWHVMDALLTEDFTFTSAAGDDHINKSVFQTKCWGTQVDFIERFDLQRVIGDGNEAFVLYACRTKNGNTFRNVEYLKLKHDKVDAIECYFGAQASYPSAVSKQPS